jgi:hypothetical protein
MRHVTDIRSEIDAGGEIEARGKLTPEVAIGVAIKGDGCQFPLWCQFPI